MPAPEPLTETPAPDLDWSRPGTPAARGFDDIYFSTDGGLAETETVFLGGCGLPDRWQGREVFTIGELGFGTGLNFLATWRMWEKARPQVGRLHFVSIEKYPLDRQQLARALSGWPELKHLSDPLIDNWPGRVRGFHRLEFGSIILTLVHADIREALADIHMQADAWFLDGFSPAKNPEMWTPDVMASIAELSAPGARLASFSVAGHFREGLTDAGFAVEKKPGFGRKRHRLEARLQGGEQFRSRNVQRPLIIGGGIAGSSLVRAFRARGIDPVLIDPVDGTAASGNPAGIVKPRLDLQDRPESRFFLSAFGYAQRAYCRESKILDKGVYHLAGTEAEKIRFSKLLANRPLPQSEMRAADDPYDGLYFPGGLILDPGATVRHFQNGSQRVRGRMDRLEQMPGSVRVLDVDNKLLAEGDSLLLAVGAGIRVMDGFDWPELRFSRGQVSWAKGQVEKTLTYGGYAIPVAADRLLLGATHTRLDGLAPYECRDADDLENLEKFRNATGYDAVLSGTSGRAAIRVNMPDTIPRCLKIGEKGFAMTGLGSRGFVFAPLMADSCVSAICAEPLPISKTMWARFQAREKPNRKARPF